MQFLNSLMGFYLQLSTRKSIGLMKNLGVDNYFSMHLYVLESPELDIMFFRKCLSFTFIVDLSDDTNIFVGALVQE